MVTGGVHFGLILIAPTIEAKIRTRHLTGAQVREALQWPATAEAAREDHPEHGERWVAVGTTGDGRQIIAWLLPEPNYLEELADTWTLKSARWV